LAFLLYFGLSLLPAWTETDSPDLRVHVTAEQFWWRIGYERPDGSRNESANEVHLPVGAVVEFVLTSPDVIHSFWIPALGGKMDAVPGRTNVLRLQPTRTGSFRGACTEFCGASHALMAFAVEIHEPEDFATWLEDEAAPAQADGAAFAKAGCSACHTIRGVSELGAVGPDLTHVASRQTLAAGTLENTPSAFRDWLVASDSIKPGSHMPNFAMLPPDEIGALVALLEGLR
jgi:cytochrome c oxidase subunit 2